MADPPLTVDRYHVQKHVVEGVGVDAVHREFHRGEHPPEVDYSRYRNHSELLAKSARRGAELANSIYITTPPWEYGQVGRVSPGVYRTPRPPASVTVNPPLTRYVFQPRHLIHLAK